MAGPSDDDWGSDAREEADAGARQDGQGDDDRAGDAPEETDDEVWKFGVDDVDEDGIVRRARTIEPESIDPENAAFVLIGVVFAVLVVLRLVAVVAP